MTPPRAKASRFKTAVAALDSMAKEPMHDDVTTALLEAEAVLKQTRPLLEVWGEAEPATTPGCAPMRLAFCRADGASGDSGWGLYIMENWRTPIRRMTYAQKLTMLERIPALAQLLFDRQAMVGTKAADLVQGVRAWAHGIRTARGAGKDGA